MVQWAKDYIVNLMKDNKTLQVESDSMIAEREGITLDCYRKRRIERKARKTREKLARRKNRNNYRK